MKKLYLPLLLIFTATASYSQEDDYEYSESSVLIERNVLGIDNISNKQSANKQAIGALHSNKTAQELPNSIYIVTHDDIVRNGCITLCDVLKTVPGIRVSQPQSGELGEAFMMRGLLGNTYTKILLNGIDVKPVGHYGMPLGANIPIRQAKEIQIIYGPASASNGSDACTGVINIITRTPDDGQFSSADIIMGTGNSRYVNFHSATKLGHGKHVAKFSIYGSNLNATDLNVPKSGELFNKWNYFFQNGDVLPMSLGDGQTYNITRDMINPHMFEKYQGLFNNVKYYFINYEGRKDPNDPLAAFYYPEVADVAQEASQLGAEFSMSNITFTYNLMHRMDFADQGQSPFAYNYEDPRNMQGDLIHRFTLSGNYKFGNLSSETSVRYIKYHMDENSSRGVNWNSGYQYAYGASDEIGAEENIIWEIFNNKEKKRMLTVSTGASFQLFGVLPPTLECERKFDFSQYKAFTKQVFYEDEYFGSFGINPYTSRQIGAYLLADLDLNRLTLSAGTRYDYNSFNKNYRNSWNPRVAALYKVTDDSRVTLRASSGWAYKTPSPAQIFYCVGVAMPNQVPGVPLTVAVHHVPSDMENIKAEDIWSNELALRYYLKGEKRRYFEVVGFSNTVKDPLVRAWVKLDPAVYPVPFFVGVTDLFSTTKGRTWTRAYKNESGMSTKLLGLMVIGVFDDIWKPIHLGVSGSLNLNKGVEHLSNNDPTAEVFNEVDYIRHTPKTLAQLSVDFDFIGRTDKKFFHMRIDNIYCTKFHRMYYQSTDNPYFVAPSYYDLDITLTGRIPNSDHLSLMFKVTNVTNALYGGIDVKNMDVDLPYNPQYLRSFRFGISYQF